MKNMFNKKHGTGALLDNRPPEKRIKDYLFSEIVIQVDPVNWEEKSTYRNFPIFDQGQSGSCVAMTLAKTLGIVHQVNEGEWITFSPGFIYQHRANKPFGGMGGVDAWDIARKHGALMEEFFPSQRKTDAQLDAYPIKNYERDVAGVFKLGNYVVMPTRDMDIIASTIQKTGKGVMVWFYFTYSEWNRAVPVLQVANLDLLAPTTLRHSVTAVDYTFYKGQKALVIEDSWGTGHGIKGQRIITEDFFNIRNFFSAYPINFKFQEQEGEPPRYTFNKDLAFGMTDPDVVALQNALKYFGHFPNNVSSTGNYYSITSKSVLEWQRKYFALDNQVTSEQELDALQGRHFGPKSRQIMNKLLRS